MTGGRFILLLIASHGIALGLGLALRGREVASPAAGGQLPAGTQQRLELSQFIVRIPPDPEEEEEDESPEARAKAAREYEEQFARIVEAIPADADVAAIVKATSTDKDKYPSTEEEAAYAVWLARDPLAALRWHLAWERERGSSSSAFGKSERYYLNHTGTAELDQLMVADPEVGRTLLMPAIFVAQKKGLDQVMALAGSLSQGNNRYDVIRYGIESGEGLAPHLPALRGMLDEQGMHEFLSNLGRGKHAAELAEAVHAAGFSETAVKTFDTLMAECAEQWRIESLPLAERIRETKDVRELDRGIQESVPDFNDWCGDFNGARLGADEVYEKLKASLPGSDAIEPELRNYLFARLFPLDATAALSWLQAEQGNWQPVAKAVMEKDGYRASFEEYFDLVGSVSPADAEASGLNRAMQHRLDHWWSQDPENCKAALQRLRPGPLKDSLLETIAKREANR